MQLTEQHIIKKSHRLWAECDRLCGLSKNLYNTSLYDVRQHFFNSGKYKTAYTQTPEFVKTKNPDYYSLPTKISAQICGQVGQNFRSFFGALKSKRAGTNNRKIRIPGYLPKSGKNIVIFPSDTISRNPVKHGDLFTHTICKRDLNLKIMSKQEHIDQVRIVPKGRYYIISIIYSVINVTELKDNNKYAAIDLGVSNVVALVSNVDNPRLYGGKLKSINQYYNKYVAKRKRELPKEVKTSKGIQDFTDKRNRKIKHELHCLSRDVVNQLVSNNVHTLIIGHNKGWKQDINIGRRNNQNFTSIPYNILIGMLKYKCELEGIKFITVEESYTSKCSFLDREPVKKHENYVGRRIKRGLFKTLSGKCINADVNGAFNIMRKVIPDETIYASKGIEGFAINPVRVKSAK